MKHIFLTLLCGISFQLWGMETKNTINLQNVDGVLTVHNLPNSTSDLSVANFDTIGKELLPYNITFQNNELTTYLNSKAEWQILTLLKMLKLFQREKSVDVAFKTEGKEEHMALRFFSRVFSHDLCTIEPGLLIIYLTFYGAHLPFSVKNDQLITEQNTKIPDSIKKLMAFLELHSKEKYYTQKEIISLPVNKLKVVIDYDIDEEKTILAKDAVLLCALLQPFNVATVIDSNLQSTIFG